MAIDRKTTEQFIKEIYDLVGDEYIVMGTYVNNRTNIPILHTKCNYVWNVKPSGILNGARCLMCFQRTLGKKKKQDEFDAQVKSIGEGKYVFIEEYKGADVPINVRHICGYTFKCSPSSFLHVGQICPICSSGYSKGEYKVKEVLDVLGIPYTSEKSFKDLGRKRFDFYLPDHNAVIEFDGEQHFKSIPSWGGMETLSKTQASDNIKNDFCEYAGIHIIRIPYWEINNVAEIVPNFIKTIVLMNSLIRSIPKNVDNSS